MFSTKFCRTSCPLSTDRVTERGTQTDRKRFAEPLNVISISPSEKRRPRTRTALNFCKVLLTFHPLTVISISKYFRSSIDGTKKVTNLREREFILLSPSLFSYMPLSRSSRSHNGVRVLSIEKYGAQ